MDRSICNWGQHLLPPIDWVEQPSQGCTHRILRKLRLDAVTPHYLSLLQHLSWRVRLITYLQNEEAGNIRRQPASTL
jgi:hypothetical protein